MSKEERVHKLESRLTVIFGQHCRQHSQTHNSLGICLCAYQHKITPGDVLAVCLAIREAGIEPQEVAARIRNGYRVWEHDGRKDQVTANLLLDEENGKLADETICLTPADILEVTASFIN